MDIEDRNAELSEKEILGCRLVAFVLKQKDQVINNRLVSLFRTEFEVRAELIVESKRWIYSPEPFEDAKRNYIFHRRGSGIVKFSLACEGESPVEVELNLETKEVSTFHTQGMIFQ